MSLAIATRSMNAFLYQVSGELLGPLRTDHARHAFTGTDNFGYFRELLRLESDWVVNLDDDAFVLDPARLLGLVRTLEEGGYAACGMPDGGVVPIRRHNPAACNAFFNVFDLRRVRPVWQAWDRVVAARHRPPFEERVAPFARRSALAFDHFERYYGVFFALLEAGERILYLDAEEWRDGITTLLKDTEGAPLLLHCWYSRYWDTSHHTRGRYQDAIEYARQAQGLSKADGRGAPPASHSAPPEELACLREPEQWLHRTRTRLAPGECVRAFVPNIRHHTVLTDLLQGHWRRDAVGSAGRPPLRFFTRRETEKLFYRCSFTIRQLTPVPGPGYEEWQLRGRPPELHLDRLRLTLSSLEEAEEFYAAGYLVDAVPAETPDHGLTSIVIVTHNQLACTRLCVESIRQYTDQPYELLCVDNSSTDRTADYLERQPHARVIRNSTNRGFPAAVNQALAVATGRQVLLLNNDTIVTTGWLDRLLHALHHDPHVGLVGPCSNFVSGAQQVEIGYDDLAQLDGFAWDWGKAHHHVVEDTDRLVGFCLLLRREVIERIGVFDERFGIGCFEDDDYCRRALQAGYRVVIARDAFIHHFGHQTFRGSGVDFAAVMETNERRFRQKWAQETPAARPHGYDVRAAPGGGLLLGRAEIELSLCMIARDNAQTIGPALESIRGFVDEMVVVDTGSKDDTPAIARRLGARVYFFPWCDSFAAARNESLRHARGKWIFWMDSDDTIDPANAGGLRQLICQAKPNDLGFVVSVHCPGAGPDEDVTVVQHVKLFCNFPQLRWEGRMHEQIISAIRALGGDILWTPLFVVHSGYDHSPEGQKRKLERDLHLLQLELDERPNHPFTLFNLAMTYTNVGRYEEGLRYARRSIAHSGKAESHLRKAYSFVVHCHERLGQADLAWQACLEGLQLFPLDDELRFRKGTLLHARGRLQEAVAAYLHLLTEREEAHFSSVVAGIAGHLARHNLALVYRDLGDLAREEEQWRQVVAEKPHYRPGWHHLGDVLVRSGQDAAAEALAERFLGDCRLRSEGRLLRSALAARRGDREAARRELECALAECPDDLEPLQALCQLLFECGHAVGAERALQDLVRRCPDNASAHQNLGVIYLRLRRPEAAEAAFRQALVHRPDCAATYLHLGCALKDQGRLPEASAAWMEALRLDPANEAVRVELEQVRSQGNNQVPSAP
jgi:GT2 family glycosyltransferase/tetratricopeptide (TPR) repeat protein